MLLLLGLLCSIWAEPAHGLEEDGGFSFEGDLRLLTVSNDSVYIATEKKLYQLSHDLVLIHSLTQRGILKNPEEENSQEFYRVSMNGAWNVTFTVNVLLPFVNNDTLISCGATEQNCGFCEVLDLKNISKVLYKEPVQVGPLRSISGSVSFLVDVKKDSVKTQTYILTAMENHTKTEKKTDNCPSDLGMINLHNTNYKQDGDIFSFSESSSPPRITAEADVEFVDGFQINSTVYLFSNVASADKPNKVRLIWLQAETSKSETLKSLHGATLRTSDGDEGSKLLASSIIPGGQQVLWSGVFSLDGGATNTELLLFDISPDGNDQTYTDPDFFYKPKKPDKQSEPVALKPKDLRFKKDHMSSVLALRLNDWIVFFIGTTDGELIKLAVDKNYRLTCPKILYKTSGDNKGFPNILLDPVDQKHVYVSFKKQVQRVPVANCSTYQNMKDCLSAQDPHCVWCVTQASCTFKDDCKDAEWLSIPDHSNQKIISHRVMEDSPGNLKIVIETHLTMEDKVRSNFACQFSTSSTPPCKEQGPQPQYPQCTCILKDPFPADGLDITINITLGKTFLKEQIKMINCSNIHGQPSVHLCQQCIRAGCGWRENSCSWATDPAQNDSICSQIDSGMGYSKPEISSIVPRVVSVHGRNDALLTGLNLRNVTRVRTQAEMYCDPKESPVRYNNGSHLTFHIPSTEIKGTVTVCAVLPDGSCHGNISVTYQSSPNCMDIVPRSSWRSGGRQVTIIGTHLDLVEEVTYTHAPAEVILHRTSNPQRLTYETPAAKDGQDSNQVLLKVVNHTVTCQNLPYYPDPEFTTFTAVKEGMDIRISIQKKADDLNLTTAELSVVGTQNGKKYNCTLIPNESGNNTFICEIKGLQNANIEFVQIKYGGKSVRLNKQSLLHLLILLIILPIPIVLVVVLVVYRNKQKQLTVKMNRLMEDLEMDIRNDIRQGFIDLQTEKADLMENVGAIPFLDYKHFASRIFFPENDSLITLCIKDIGQDVEKVELEEHCQIFSKLIQDQVFLTTMVHALEEQKSFTIKDKCTFASLLTVALHSNLSYLTEVMEVLLKDLMQQNSSAQPKLLLRRTESTVEKLLTNWVSVCLYGFLRESVGQHLFLLVSALTQQISKGPVDCVTEKALYTLSEDWLLWQAQDFSPLKLKALFAVGSDGEVSEPLEVDALSCDTVEQLKEKILNTFKTKFGFPYNTAVRDVYIEYEKDGSFTPLQEVDAGSEVIGEVTKLNTLRHYKVNDGATIKVLSKKTHPPVSPQGSVKDDENFSGKYFHLIDPDVVEDHGKNPERKKLKLKEVYLTKLLSTKVAVHSYVENLFRSIWGTSQSRAPLAIKYFFDFLDAQAENMKITDPDVRHIWKTNSLPLRFWINILKNPQFVFDMEKTPHLDGCLSVIAQAFMDSFSLSDTQLGKHAPTNKLLYAKDIPKFKQEVKAYYKQIREQSAVTEAQFKDFLQGESKKHEGEFNEAAALKELYKFIQRYFTEVKEKLASSGAPAELTEQLQHVKNLFDGMKSCSWN
ncbi:plexin-C1 isoform X1 [Fundulus heteroclitus]|uniref:plexin-C1 isoform X1 n=1 Tax=Fundulus heteroclitus TaxID=8078 RepID=UPI00165B50DB|nr:plexin-C1 isoform X1 [Fundulus heteroclitus]